MGGTAYPLPRRRSRHCIFGKERCGRFRIELCGGLAFAGRASAETLLAQHRGAKRAARAAPRPKAEAAAPDTRTITRAAFTSGRVNSRPSPAGGREDAASLDRPCARRLRELAVGMEECSRRGSNQRMRPKRARKPTISNCWFSGNFRLAMTAVNKPVKRPGPPISAARNGSRSDWISQKMLAATADCNKPPPQLAAVPSEIGQFTPPTRMISGGGTCFDCGPAARRKGGPLASRPAARGYQPASSTRYDRRPLGFDCQTFRQCGVI